MKHLINILQAEVPISHPPRKTLINFFFSLYFCCKESNTTLDINNVVEAEAVLIGGLLDSDMYPVIGEKWENEFLRSEI